ncbi:hypothetical protein FGG08_005478 [Glutinoglossum americanum]|uniref:BZIP domain-containing protein n=1 Tax=Glutinoglossum americanum TaxID=1670608 RepID=A0A9P8KW02_9PEZI|nr:hypothetical protein FGG08_005478 [Glutinoglossum americanum]
MSFGIPGHDDMTVVGKAEPGRDGSTSSLGSSPEPEIDSFPTETTGTQKRKGGRKPIYATSEERKQRNRQAQAAFRERRTEYIKHLEATIKNHEETLASLQQSHRSAADECLMLRYKNSLLERILLEKGIDVQAELRAKTGSPHVGPLSVATPATETPPMQRAIMNRHHQARRSHSGIAPKIEPNNQLQHGSRGHVFTGQSPQLQPTPPSQAASSNPTSPIYGVMTPPASDRLAQHQHQQQQQHRQQQAPNTHPQTAYSIPMAVTSSSGPSHISITSGPGSSGTCKQEYEAQADMVDDQDTSDHSTAPGPFSQAFLQQATHGLPVSQHVPPQSLHQGDTTGPFDAVNQLFDPYDPMLDADPFGLSASMHFPTPFSFETSSMR